MRKKVRSALLRVIAFAALGLLIPATAARIFFFGAALLWLSLAGLTMMADRHYPSDTQELPEERPRRP